MKLGCPLLVMLSCYILCCSLLMSHCHGIAETSKSFEDFEIEKKLKLINKPAVKIIKSISGERYGCVDFYKQPGLDHSSMKNHTFTYKMCLMSYPEGSKMKRKTHTSNKTFGHLWENGIGCPVGTVPILRVTKNALLKLKSFIANNSNPQSSWSKTYEPASSNDGHHFAVIRTKGKPKRYTGASMNVATYTPLVGPMQFSDARMHFQIGNEFMQVGWTVNPQLYHDFNSRLFVFTSSGGRGCYHLLCPNGFGMILVRQDFTPGLLAGQGDIDFAIIKDQINGNWWLMMGSSWEEIGFWPSNRFKESYGTSIEWGGEVYSPSLPSPPMGNGHYPKGSPKVDSYIRLITTVDENYKTDKSVENTERYSDHCYKVTDTLESFWTHTGHLILYGGPGCK
ncbi:uncharacterized protein LOC17899944 [Capsella rubella]|uniref:uncharacterized protein LOC17899944 n=1 Tax=Capsella rubella TaxID=81985 RepID=UPI000CD55E7D|nr:uncharacterized protein LOC17899944 [Capsella rubella]